MSAEQQVVRYHTADGRGVRHAIVSEGRTKLLAVLVMDSGVKAERLPKTEQRFMTPTDYPVGKAKKRFRSAARRLGCTKSARRLIRGQS